MDSSMIYIYAYMCVMVRIKVQLTVQRNAMHSNFSCFLHFFLSFRNFRKTWKTVRHRYLNIIKTWRFGWYYWYTHHNHVLHIIHVTRRIIWHEGFSFSNSESSSKGFRLASEPSPPKRTCVGDDRPTCRSPWRTPPPTTTAEPPPGRGYTKQLEEMNGLAKVERLRRLDWECSHSIHGTGIFTYDNTMPPGR